MKALISTLVTTAMIAGPMATSAASAQTTYPNNASYPQWQGPGTNTGFASTLRCDAPRNQKVRCKVRHEDRVMIVERHDGNCVDGRDWGTERKAIWVSRYCKATFAYGYGDYWPYPEQRPQPDKNKGPSTGLIIGGVVVAAGLAALLLSKKKKGQAEPDASASTTFPPKGPAAITANLSALTASQRPAMQQCLNEASRHVGVTGGSKIALDKITETEAGNGGWRFRATLTGTYPDGDREMSIYCRATSSKVVQIDFT